MNSHNLSIDEDQSKEAGVLLWGRISLVVGCVVLALKWWAYQLTSSEAVFSDALESIVNVLAAGFTLWMLRVASRPADRNHPYGHGKGEFFSSAFEGGLITFAAALILLESGHALWSGKTVGQPSLGMLAIGAAGALNFALGMVLLSYGRKHHSVALIASGHHVSSDFWTTVVALLGLFLVQVTGLHWIDPVLGCGLGIFIGYTGAKILRGSIGGLLDEEDMEILSALVNAFSNVRVPGIIGVHRTRVMRSGRYHYIDAHVVAPEFWDIKHAHDETNNFERKVMEAYPFGGEIHFHIDPCRQSYCRVCDLTECPIRKDAFQQRISYSIEEITGIHSSA